MDLTLKEGQLNGMNLTKDDIIEKYKILKKYLGRQPSATIFFAETGLRNRHLEKFFGSDCYSKLVIECGDIPNKFGVPKSDINEILVQWGKLAREKGKIPAGADWRFNNYKPTIEGIRISHNINWTDLPYKFLELNYHVEEWQDVIALIPNRSDKIISAPTKEIDGIAFENLQFIPPIVRELVDFSVNEEKSRDFEKSVNLVFQMLGFEVIAYGQGTGRNPDGIAKEHQNRYAILIDAKSRKESYKIGTEDRKFIEYIKTFSEPLRKNGFTKVYFVIISSGFDTISATSIKNIKLETQVPTSLLTSKRLLKILAAKIKNPRLFELKKFQELFINDGEITDKQIEKFIAITK